MTSQELNNIFESFSHLKALIIGDVMVDAYLWGNVDRISPEAPVPVVSVTKKEHRLGGAANVVLNVQALGATPIVCSVIGNDENGQLFLDLLKKRNLSSKGIIQSESRKTTVKTRVIGGNQQMLRVDQEIEEEITLDEANQLFERISEIISKENIDVIIFQDYDKGIITSDLIEKVAGFAKLNNIPVAADPKKKNFLNYKGISLFKPNLKELKEGLNVDLDIGNENEFHEAIEKFKQQQGIEAVMVTLSSKGIFVSNAESQIVIPAHPRDVADVSGAGDTVISVAALCLALNLPSVFTAKLANLAGGQVCEKVGVVPIDQELLKKEATQLLSE
ncbi:MAG: D-glycero-beta-D-manno-heptose-7-phosphate kinase [Flavobacteriales bacterium]|nr:hypothetical protein [Bacteroidales bacterium AH-315-I05]PCJ86340.1 MAG: D-glycero-beta-D-manno-heptose-7-phosphate kinase [Flavobacteriales bacterium]